MNRIIKLMILLAVILSLSGCSGLTPRAGAGVGVGIGLDFTKKVPVRPYIGGGIGAGLFRFF